MERLPKSLVLKSKQIASDKSELIPHGGQVRFSGPYGGVEQDIDAQAKEIQAAVSEGLQQLHMGESQFAPDAEPVGEPQYCEYFDVKTGDYVVNWFVWCKQRSADSTH